MLDSVFDVFSGQSERDRQISELRAMEDHELADLGILRDQIEAFVDAHSSEDRMYD